MAVGPFSRYADNTIISLADSDGISRPTIIIEPPDARQISFSTYTWRNGDQIEYLAYSAYGDEQSWWIIADSNPEIMFWNAVPEGTDVRVPNA